MAKITNAESVKMAIQQLEGEQARQWPLLKEQFGITYESLKPVNFIKSTIDELEKTSDSNGDLLTTSVSYAVGYLSKKAVIGKSRNPIKQIFGTLLQMGVSGIVSKNSDKVKSVMQFLVNNISKKK